LRFCDNLTFLGTHIISSGPALKLLPANGDSAFPQAVTFFNASFEGGVSVGPGWTGKHPIFFWPYSVTDGEAVPDNPALAGITSQGQFFGSLAWPSSR